MIRSMTGFGSARTETGRGTVAVEVRSVNGRHLRTNLRLPPGCEGWEARVKEVVSRHLSRGRVSLALEVEEADDGPPPLELDGERVESYLTAFRKLREEYALPGQVDLSLLVRAGGLLRERDRREPEWLEWETVKSVLEGAMAELVEMREREGRELERDLRSRLEAIRKGIAGVRDRAPERLERERERLRGAVAELLEDVGSGDERRLEREIALLADRWDVGEEITRAAAHVDGFEEFLERGASEPVGRRLDFLAQELHREINTMGAKANDPGISREVVEMKNELESIREQVENVE